MKTIYFGIFIMTVTVLDVQGVGIACTREGKMCKDCFTLVTCIKDEASPTGFTYADNPEKCVTGFVCDEWNLLCIRRGTCRSKPFTCPKNNYDTEKLFPDPYSCNAYHGCEGDDQEDYECFGGKAFDPKTGKCSSDIEDNPSCLDYPALCEKEGEEGTIGDSDYKYKCVKENGKINLIYPSITYHGSTKIH